MFLKEHCKLDFLMKTLMMDNTEDAASFADSCGFINFNKAEDSVDFSMKRQLLEYWSGKFKAWKQQGNVPVLEILRGSALRRTLMKNDMQLKK